MSLLRTLATKPRDPKRTTSANATRPGGARCGLSREESSIIHLQRTTGNQAVQRVLDASSKERAEPRSRMVISNPEGRDEQQADRVANQVMGLPEPRSHRARTPPEVGNPDRASHQNSGKGEERPRRGQLQTNRCLAANAEQGTVPSTVQQVLSSPGRLMDPSTRALMESRFGHDFGDVRIHTGRAAAQSAAAIASRAFTAGHHIVFGASEFAPQTPQGRQLLAHELTHVLQQTGNHPGVASAHHTGHRLIQRVRWTGEGAFPMTPAEFRRYLIGLVPSQTTQLSSMSSGLLRRFLDPATGPPAFFQMLNGYVRQSLGRQHQGQLTLASQAAPRLATILEGAIRAFIADPNTSGLDLLPAAQTRRYRAFGWHRDDYPGRPHGPNEGRAHAMARHLSGIRPERRVNRGPHAVVTQAQYNQRIARHILANLQNIPAFPAPAHQQPAGRRLYGQARDSFLRMRAAAWADGVPLIILDSYRNPAVAAANAAAAANPWAVARYSPHILGLAVDLRMSLGAQQYLETTTRPMQNVVDMRQSPVHKWMFLRGAEFGWYPLQNEPWHWEYNPPGFPQQFRRAAAPPAAAAGGGP